MPTTDAYNAFGDLIRAPQSLPPAERIALLRRAAESLRVGKIDRRVAQWLAQVLDEHLQDGADLAQLLGTRPERGCTMTPARRAAAQRHGTLLLQLSVLCGGDRAAARVLTGTVPCPARAQDLVRELNASKGGHSLSAFVRARTRHG